MDYKHRTKGVGSSRREPWTRLHCSELHWRDPVALSVGQPGAPMSSKACTWIGCPFSESVVSSWPTRWVSGSLFWISCWTPWLRRCNALQVWYWDEDAREAPEQFCRIFSNLAPCDYARLRICFPVAAAGRSWHNVLLTLHVATGFFSPSTWYGIMSAQWWTWWVTDFGWSPTLPYVTVLATATELLPVRGAVLLQVSCLQFALPAPEPTVRFTANAFRLEPNTWARTCERTLRG